MTAPAQEIVRPLVAVARGTWSQSSYSKPGHGSYRLLLACGHEAVRKGSQGLPFRVRCWSCPPIVRDIRPLVLRTYGGGKSIGQQ